MRRNLAAAVWALGLTVLSSASTQAAPVTASRAVSLGQVGAAPSRAELEWREVASHATPDGGRIVRYAQWHSGRPVWGGVLTARLDSSGRVVRSSDGSKAITAEIAAAPLVTATGALDAVRTALAGVPFHATPRAAAALVVSPAAGGRLAWLVDVDSLNPAQSPSGLVDALTGEVLSVWNRARLAGEATVFANGSNAKSARQSDGRFSGGTSTVTLSGLSSTAESAVLSGVDVVAVNCCPTEGCDPAKEPKKSSGNLAFNTPIGPLQVTINTVLCDEVPVAKADAEGRFAFTPAQEPVKGDEPVPGPSEADPFSEVMAYHYAQAELDFVRSLDPAFQMGPNARPLHVTANFLIPDFNDLQSNDIQQVLQTRTVNISHLARFGNAAYVPRGQASRIGATLPGFGHDYDFLMIGQGPTGDFGYDPDVIAHEVGHGVVEVSAGLLDYSTDDQGILDAPGALNEAFSDLLTAMRENDPRIGEYVGEYGMDGEGALRDLENDFSCPTVITGEVHQDSQHFSAAVWAARRAVAGSDSAAQKRFDQAILGALRQLRPDSSFDDAGEALLSEVAVLFDAAARTSADAELSKRRIIGCERVLDLNPGTPRTGYFLAPMNAERGFTPFAPGPVQFRLAVPAGTTSIRLTSRGGGGGLGGMGLPGAGGGGGGLQALFRPDERIRFTFTSSGVTSDASKKLSFANGAVQTSIEASCAPTTWFVALGNTGGGVYQLESLDVSYNVDSTKLAACNETPGGTDGGTIEDGSGGEVASPGGCDCSSLDGLAMMTLAGLAARAFRRRSRER